MAKTFVGPQLRQLRRDRRQTQAEMAKALGVSAGYVNLLENNERSLSLRILMAVADNYGVDRRDLVADKTSNLLAELHSELRTLCFRPRRILQRCARQSIMRRAWSSSSSTFMAFIACARTPDALRLEHADRLLATSAEAVVHDFFRDNSNFCPRRSITPTRYES